MKKFWNFRNLKVLLYSGQSLFLLPSYYTFGFVCVYPWKSDDKKHARSSQNISGNLVSITGIFFWLWKHCIDWKNVNWWFIRFHVLCFIKVIFLVIKFILWCDTKCVSFFNVCVKYNHSVYYTQSLAELCYTPKYWKG